MDEEEAQSSNAEVRLLEDEGERRLFRVESPPPDWALNSLLIKIDKGMTPGELEEVKTLFKGQEGIGLKVLEGIRRPLELFNILRQRTFLDRYNMLYLEAMLFHIKRKDLLDLAVEYSESCEGIVHFKSPPTEPASWHEFVEFHVAGTGSYNTSSLKAIRELVATLVGKDPKCVTIAGIEPSASLLITLMVPKNCIQKLEAELLLDATVKQLVDLGIDRVKLNGRTFRLKEVKSIEAESLIQQNQLADMYKKLRTTEEHLEERELECLKLNQQLKKEVVKTIEVSCRNMAVLMGTVFRAYANMRIPKLSRQSALVYLRYWYRRLEQQNISKETREVISNLLDANGIAVAARIQEAQTISLHDLQVALLEQAIAIEREQLGLFGTIKTHLGKFQLESQKKNIVQVQRTISSTQFDEYSYRVFEEISNLLSETERRKLIEKYTWPENESLTSHIRNKDKPLIACLLHKECELTGSVVEAGPFVSKLLTDVKREDLVQKFATRWKEKAQSPIQPSEELKEIQRQLNLLHEKVDNIQHRINPDNMPLQPSINFCPSLNMNALNFDFGSETFRKLIMDQANVKEMPLTQHMS